MKRSEPLAIVTIAVIMSCLTGCKRSTSSAPAPEEASDPPGAPTPMKRTEPAGTSTPAPPTTAQLVVPGAKPVAGYADVLKRLDANIAFFAKRAAGREKGGWLDLDKVASGYLSRARLTGDFEDYAKAEAALKQAYSRAPKKAGPHLTRAGLNFTLHRLARVEADLEAAGSAVIVDAQTRNTIGATRADVAFHSGRYAEAKAGYEAALKQDRSRTNLFRMAVYRWKTGDLDGAEALISEAQKPFLKRGGQMAAWWHLQRGLIELDRGRWDGALAHYSLADSALPGWWLIEEHMAEILALQGKRQPALRAYRALVERTGNPEFMDAIVELLAEENPAGANRMRTRARAAWEARLARFPEAAFGHGLDHFLADPAQKERALTLAQANVAARPGGEAHTKLAEALLGAGKTAEALAAIERVLASPFRTADLHVTAAGIYEAAGKGTLAAAQRKAALALNPHALD